MERIEVEHCDYIHVHKDTVDKVKSCLPAEEELTELAGFFKVFGDVTRIKILCVLLQSEMCVCDLAQTLNISPHQLSYVTQANEGEGLLFYGNVIVPFVDRFPKDTEMYRMMTTKFSDLQKGQNAA